MISLQRIAMLVRQAINEAGDVMQRDITATSRHQSINKHRVSASEDSEHASEE